MTFIVSGTLSVAATVALLGGGEPRRKAGWWLSMLSVLVVVAAYGARFGFLSAREVGLLAVTGVVTLADLALSGSAIGCLGEEHERLKGVIFHALRVTLVCCVACQQVEYPGTGSIHEIGLATSNAILVPLVVCLSVLVVMRACERLRSRVPIYVGLLLSLVVMASLYGGLGTLGASVREMVDRVSFSVSGEELIVAIGLVWTVLLFSQDGFPLLVLLPIGCAAFFGNALLSLGLVALGVACVPRDAPRRRKALFVGACLGVCAVATIVSLEYSMRAYSAACDWLGTFGFPCGDPYTEPLRATTASGGLLGAGFGPEPDLPPMTARLIGGVHDLAACLYRLGLFGGIGITVPWVACAVLGVRSLRGGGITATAMAATVTGIAQLLCVLACLGVLPALCPREVPVCASYSQNAMAALFFIPFALTFDAAFAVPDEDAGEAEGDEGDAAAQKPYDKAPDR